jgi:hypothetical protein
MIKFTGQFSFDDCYCNLNLVRSKKHVLKTNTLQNSILGVKKKQLLIGDLFFNFRIPGALGIG